MLGIAARELIEAELEDSQQVEIKNEKPRAQSRTIGRSHCFLSRFCMAVASS